MSLVPTAPRGQEASGIVRHTRPQRVSRSLLRGHICKLHFILRTSTQAVVRNQRSTIPVMGRRRGIKSKQKPDQLLQKRPQGLDPADLASPEPVLFAFQSGHKTFALASGPKITVYSSCEEVHQDLLTVANPTDGRPSAAPVVQALAFSAHSPHLIAGGDDKCLRLWCTDTWRLLQLWQVPKRICAAAFSANGHHIFFADKFGDVHVVQVSQQGDAGTVTPSLDVGPPPSRLNHGKSVEQDHPSTSSTAAATSALLLGHFCSIITSLNVSSDGKYIVSTDRDHKVRVSNLPADPLQGAPEIQSYCLGHTAFATCSEFMMLEQHELLLSGSGDGTVRLWDHVSGAQLARWDASAADKATPTQSEAAIDDAEAPGAEQAAVSSANGAERTQASAAQVVGALSPHQDVLDDEEEGGGDEDEPNTVPEPSGRPAVLGLAAFCSWPHSRPRVAVIIEGSPAVTVLELDAAGPSLQTSQELRCTEDGNLLPATVGFDNQGRLWAACKVPAAAETVVSLHVWELDADDGSCFKAALQHGGLSSSLQRALHDHPVPEPHGQPGIMGQISQGSQHLRKRQYSQEEIDERKRNRKYTPSLLH